MKAVTVKQPGGADQLQVVDVEKPIVNEGELLIKVHAAAINRTDILNRQSPLGYMANPILGIEVSGLVEEVGAGTKLPVGTRVMGLVNGGAYAEYVVMQEENAMVIPDHLSFEEGAAIPEVFLTAYQTLFWIGRLAEHERVLIHAGGSGVGTAAIQLSKALANATVLTTAGSQDKLDICQTLGADVLINYKKEQFEETVLQATDEAGANVILDFVGASYWEKNLTSVAVDGHWVLIGILGGKTVPEVDLFDVMKKRVQITGTLLTPRSDAYKAALTTEFAERALPLFAEGKIRPIVDTIFSLDDIQQAHEHMEANKNIGKIIIRVAE